MTDDTPPVNRYSAMANEAELNLWHGTFKTFDRDGGGDVDLRELGMMFRQLGQAPNEREMRLLIEEVDADGSGTIDFEEFCCLMLRQARSARTPEWMVELLPADADEEEVAALPSVAMLSDAKHVAARMIQKKMAARRGGAASSAPSDPKLAPPAALFDEDLTREQLLMVVDLLPSAVHVTEAHLAGHGSRFGPFVAAELAWRLATSTRTRISSLGACAAFFFRRVRARCFCSGASSSFRPSLAADGASLARAAQTSPSTASVTRAPRRSRARCARTRTCATSTSRATASPSAARVRSWARCACSSRAGGSRRCAAFRSTRI